MHRARAGGYAGVVLGLVTDALEIVAAGKDPRPLVCSALADALDADVAGFVDRERRHRHTTVVVQPAALPTSPDDLLVRQLFRRACGVPLSESTDERPEVDARVARLPVPVIGHGTDLFVFVRSDGFAPDTTMLLRCAQAPAGAIGRVYRRTTPPVEVLDGPTARLTVREQEVLRLLSEGLLARTIAARLEVSPRTIHHHLGSIYAKLGVCDRLAAVLQARAQGLLDGVALSPDVPMSEARRPLEQPLAR